MAIRVWHLLAGNNGHSPNKLCQWGICGHSQMGYARGNKAIRVWAMLVGIYGNSRVARTGHVHRQRLFSE
jgi:hypothetical protein